MTKKIFLFKTFTIWALQMLTISLSFALIYCVAQQILRQGANDPQIQLAEDISIDLGNGRPPQTIINGKAIDLATTLRPFMTIYDDTGKPLTTSANLDGKAPEIPMGVFDYTRNTGEDRITWQPKAGLRYAVIVKHYTGKQTGFVIVGRSLREVEKQTDRFTKKILIAYAGSAFLTLIASLVFVKVSKH